MLPIGAISAWALLGAFLSLALRPVVVRSLSKASPSAVLPPLGVLEGLTAALFAALAYRLGAQVELLAFSALVTTCVPLAALDLIARKLPNILIGTTYVGVLPLLGLDAILNGPDQLTRALLSMMAALVAHGVLYAAGAVGGGDLKLVGALAAALGWVSWTATWTGFIAGWLIGGLAVLTGTAFRGKQRLPNVPLGLYLIAGTLLTLLTLGAPVQSDLPAPVE
ncbi:prepilin peptidase [Actinophytocola sp.]|uniref:prepilin peptidase n=1 Tax=Actinophytocola sp. TaxID=1872138 RepID=UPI0025BB371F|nr:prepilin peptidase [Actinophytocola sp.]